jgi:hypothetical protein
MEERPDARMAQRPSPWVTTGFPAVIGTVLARRHGASVSRGPYCQAVKCGRRPSPALGLVRPLR